MTMIHDLKILPEYFEAVKNGDKKFEIRKNDRNFHKGDSLRLREWSEDYTGREIEVLVDYILYDWSGGLQNGYCIMSIRPMPQKPINNVFWSLCRSCDNLVERSDNFCRYCGIQIDWSK